MDRPLPYLIGSQAFMEQDDVGLGDLSSDGKVHASPGACTLSVVFPFFSRVCVCVIVYSEMSVDSDRDSVIESEDGKESVVRQSFLFFYHNFQAFF